MLAFSIMITQPSNLYRKVPKFSDARIFCCNLPLKFKQRGQTLGSLCQNDVNGLANSEYPDQTSPLGEHSDLGLHCLS